MKILLKQNSFSLLTLFLTKKKHQNVTQVHMEVEQNEDTRTLLGMGSGF
jgi:hypothetical protein